MRRTPKFIQIATCATGGRQELYALDAEGNVWTYTHGPLEDAPFSQEWFWKPLETERRGSPAVVSGRSNE